MLNTTSWIECYLLTLPKVSRDRLFLIIVSVTIRNLRQRHFSFDSNEVSLSEHEDKMWVKQVDISTKYITEEAHMFTSLHKVKPSGLGSRAEESINKRVPIKYFPPFRSFQRDERGGGALTAGAPKSLSPLEGSALEFISHRLSDWCATHPVLILLDLVHVSPLLRRIVLERGPWGKALKRSVLIAGTCSTLTAFRGRFDPLWRVVPFRAAILRGIRVKPLTSWYFSE